MDQLPEFSVESLVFGLPDLSRTVLMDLDYEQILATARASSLIAPDEAFWRAKVLRILGFSSSEEVNQRVEKYVAGNTVTGHNDKNAWRRIQRSVHGIEALAVESILACRVPYVRALYQTAPGLLELYKVLRALRTFFEHSANLDCAAAYANIFRDDKYFTRVTGGNLAIDVRKAIEVPGEIHAQSNRTVYTGIEEALRELQGPERAQATTEEFFKGLNSTLLPADFRRILKHEHMIYIIKGMGFYARLIKSFETRGDAVRRHYLAAKARMLKHTDIAHPGTKIRVVLSSTSRAAKFWRMAGLPKENIIGMELVREDVSEEFGPFFLSMLGGAGGDTRIEALEQILLSKTLLLCWQDEAMTEHTYRITLKTYNTLREILLKPESHPETTEYLKTLVAATVYNIRVFNLLWAWTTEGEEQLLGIGGSAIVPSPDARKMIKRRIEREIQAYVDKINARVPH